MGGPLEARLPAGNRLLMERGTCAEDSGNVVCAVSFKKGIRGGAQRITKGEPLSSRIPFSLD